MDLWPGIHSLEASHVSIPSTTARAAARSWSPRIDTLYPDPLRASTRPRVLS